MTEEKNVKVRSKEYPALTISKTIEFIKKFKDFPLNKPLSYDTAAKNIGVSKTTKSFKYSISSAKQYGLITTSTGEIINFTDTGKNIIQTEIVDSKIMAICFRNPKLYEELINDYNGKSLPSVDKLETILSSTYGIAPNASKKAAEIFVSSAEESGSVTNGILDVDNSFNEDNLEEKIVDFDIRDSVGVSTQSSLDTKLYEEKVSEEFDAPLTIPFGDKRKAILYMPINSTSDEAEYVQEMISLMFKRVYGTNRNK